MPEYVYGCPAGHRAVVAHPMLQDPLVPCAECGQRMRRVPQAHAINWGSLRPSAGELHPNIQRAIADAPRKREEYMEKHND